MDIRICQHPDQVQALLQLFEQIGQEEGWQPGDQIQAHVQRSVYFAAFLEQRPVGGLQLVQPDLNGQIPTHQVWPELPPVDDTVRHAAILAVLPEFRGKDRAAAFWRLGAALWRYCIDHQVRSLYLEATPTTLRAYRLLGWPLAVAGELREHWGEPCYPCTLTLREVAGSLAERATRSGLYQGILDVMTGRA